MKIVTLRACIWFWKRRTEAHDRIVNLRMSFAILGLGILLQ